MNGSDFGRGLDGLIAGAIVVAAVVAICLWELAQWVMLHLRVEWVP